MKGLACIALGAGLLLACSSSAKSREPAAELTPERELPPPPSTDAGGASKEDLAACKSEVIALPPDFAPSLPKGGEVLWFAPGMFDTDAPGYFRYAFRLDFEKPQSVSPASLEDLLTRYYQGLMSAVAKGDKRTHPEGATVVQVRASDLAGFPQDCRDKGCVEANTFFEATIETIDEFTSHKAITLKLLMSAKPNTIVASVLPAAQWKGKSLVHGLGQGPAEGHLLPLGCKSDPAVDDASRTSDP